MMNDHMVKAMLAAMQAAMVEWRYGRGAESALEFISNCLDEFDLLPPFVEVSGRKQCGASPTPPPIERRRWPRDPAPSGPLVRTQEAHAAQALQQSIAGLSEAPTLLRLPEVEVQVRIKRSTIYHEMAAGRFPRPIKIGNSSFWLESEIRAHLASLSNPRGVPQAEPEILFTSADRALLERVAGLIEQLPERMGFNETDAPAPAPARAWSQLPPSRPSPRGTGRLPAGSWSTHGAQDDDE